MILSKANFQKLILTAAIFQFGLASAQEDFVSMHQWKTKGGIVIVTSGLLTNGMALYTHNYNFYFQKDGEKQWYQIPLLDKSKPGEYELNLTARAKNERMVKDARLEIRGNEIFLLRAQSTRENDLEDSLIIVTKYHFIATDGEDWPYLFQKISSKTLRTIKNMGVDAILNEESRLIK